MHTQGRGSGTAQLDGYSIMECDLGCTCCFRQCHWEDWSSLKCVRTYVKVVGSVLFCSVLFLQVRVGYLLFRPVELKLCKVFINLQRWQNLG